MPAGLEPSDPVNARHIVALTRRYTVCGCAARLTEEFAMISAFPVITVTPSPTNRHLLEGHR